MEAIIELTKVNFSFVFISVFSVLVGIKAVVSVLEWVIDKFGIETKRMRRKREDHELIIQTSQTLLELQKKHDEDVHQSDEHDAEIKEALSTFISEIKTIISETQSEIKQFTENRIHDREQSFKIQKELSDSISHINEKGIERDKQIETLALGNKELLANIINDRYQRYLLLEGIPADEADEFTNIYYAYKSLGGNHNGDQKYNYVIKHLPVIPVKTKLVTKEIEPLEE